MSEEILLCIYIYIHENLYLFKKNTYIHIHTLCILYIYMCVCVVLLVVRLVSPNGNERIKLAIHHDQFCLCSPPQRSQHPKQARCKGLEATWPAWITKSLLVSTKLAVSTPLKNISQLGLLFPIYGKIKNVPNHPPGTVDSLVTFLAS